MHTKAANVRIVVAKANAPAMAFAALHVGDLAMPHQKYENLCAVEYLLAGKLVFNRYPFAHLNLLAD
jgi:branched-subunit amino acid transport protein